MNKCGLWEYTTTGSRSSCVDYTHSSYSRLHTSTYLVVHLGYIIIIWFTSTSQPAIQSYEFYLQNQYVLKLSTCSTPTFSSSSTSTDSRLTHVVSHDHTCCFRCMITWLRVVSRVSQPPPLPVGVLCTDIFSIWCPIQKKKRAREQEDHSFHSCVYVYSYRYQNLLQQAAVHAVCLICTSLSQFGCRTF